MLNLFLMLNNTLVVCSYGYRPWTAKYLTACYPVTSHLRQSVRDGFHPTTLALITLVCKTLYVFTTFAYSGCLVPKRVCAVLIKTGEAVQHTPAGSQKASTSRSEPTRPETLPRSNAVLKNSTLYYEVEWCVIAFWYRNNHIFSGDYLLYRNPTVDGDTRPNSVLQKQLIDNAYPNLFSRYRMLEYLNQVHILLWNAIPVESNNVRVHAASDVLMLCCFSDFGCHAAILYSRSSFVSSKRARRLVFSMSKKIAALCSLVKCCCNGRRTIFRRLDTAMCSTRIMRGVRTNDKIIA